MLLLRHNLDELQKSIGLFTFARGGTRSAFRDLQRPAQQEEVPVPPAQPHEQLVDPLVSILSARLRLTSE
jgi:hypothetical protein